MELPEKEPLTRAERVKMLVWIVVIAAIYCLGVYLLSGETRPACPACERNAAAKAAKPDGNHFLPTWAE